MAQKCGSCGADLGNNEMLQMFQAQAQNAKGVTGAPPPTAAPAPGNGGAHAAELSASAVIPAAHADDFFADLSHSQPPRKEQAHNNSFDDSLNQSKKQVAQSFFAQMESVAAEEPAFETEIGPLRDEDKKLAAHPLFSPPVNSHVEAYIARRNKMN